MAVNNPYKNKVVYNGTTLIDLTADTVSAQDVAEGVTFHLPSGQPSTGTLVIQEDDGETLVLLKYGTSTWQDFIDAYTTNSIVYCRASSQSNPAKGSQTRLAFMAYVNNETNPTEVEFQYYRSVSSHSNSQQGDQVYVYKLNKTNGWSVIVRQAYTKIVAGTGLTSSYSNGVITISLAQ